MKRCRILQKHSVFCGLRHFILQDTSQICLNRNEFVSGKCTDEKNYLADAYKGLAARTISAYSLFNSSKAFSASFGIST